MKLSVQLILPVVYFACCVLLQRAKADTDETCSIDDGKFTLSVKIISPTLVFKNLIICLRIKPSYMRCER
jgi:hypothetical protein